MNKCPDCGASWEALAQCLAESSEGGLESENHAQARTILANCPTCSAFFANEEKNEN